MYFPKYSYFFTDCNNVPEFGSQKRLLLFERQQNENPAMGDRPWSCDQSRVAEVRIFATTFLTKSKATRSLSGNRPSMICHF